MQPASFSSRFAAMNLDYLFCGAFLQAFSLGLEKLAPEAATPTVLLLFTLIFSIAYFVLPTKRGGQTLGKKLMAIKVVPDHNSKAALTWGQVWKRELLGKLLGTLPLGLGYLWAYFNREHRAWHDSLGHTSVITLIWEDEKSSAHKLQQTLIAVISVPAGVALILVFFLYTSMPLNSIREKIEASGIQVGALSGSLAGGLHFSEIRRTDPEPPFALKSVDVKFNLWSLVAEKAFLVEKITAEEGRVEVPENFSFPVILNNILTLLRDPVVIGTLRDFTLNKLQLKNISFENHDKVLSRLEDVSLKNLVLADSEFSVSELQVAIPGFKVRAQDVKSAFGRIEVGNATGGVTPELLPLLKAPVDFTLKGSLGKNPKTTHIEAGLMIEKVKIRYEAEKLTLGVDKLILNEMFKMGVPVDELDMKLTTQGATVAEALSALTVEYGLKICGQEFKVDPVKGPLFEKDGRVFSFHMTPLPVLDFNQTVLAPEATLDDLFGYQLTASKAPGKGAYASPQEMLADLCFQKAPSALSAAETEMLASFAKALQREKLLNPSPAVAKDADESAPEATEAAEPTESPASPEPRTLLKEAMADAKNLLREGKILDALARMEKISLPSEGISAEEQGAFYNLQAWLYLYSGQPEPAARHFEQAFNARKDIGDAEGLQRANEALKKDQEARKWLAYIKDHLKTNPELKSQLTQNMLKKLASEVSEESHP